MNENSSHENISATPEIPPTLGRIVYYVAPWPVYLSRDIEERLRAAIVTRVCNEHGQVDLNVHCNGADGNVPGLKVKAVHYSAERERGTWHWPPREPAAEPLPPLEPNKQLIDAIQGGDVNASWKLCYLEPNPAAAPLVDMRHWPPILEPAQLYDGTYKQAAWMSYDIAEIGQWVHLLMKRSTHRDTVAEGRRDLELAYVYLYMMETKLGLLLCDRQRLEAFQNLPRDEQANEMSWWMAFRQQRYDCAMTLVDNAIRQMSAWRQAQDAGEDTAKGTDADTTENPTAENPSASALEPTAADGAPHAEGP